MHLIKATLVMALLTQVTHAAHLFLLISKTSGWVEVVISYLFAISLEMSIYIFTIEEKKRVATFFAVVSILINLLYYWNFSKIDQSFYGSLLVSFIMPITIWNYSDLIVPKKRIYNRKEN